VYRENLLALVTTSDSSGASIRNSQIRSSLEFDGIGKSSMDLRVRAADAVCWPAHGCFASPSVGVLA